MRRVGSLFGLVLVLYSATALATVLPARSMDQMVGDAGLIVQGKVLSKRSFWAPKKSRIYTEITLQVIESLKGTAGSTLRLHKLGGQMGNYASSVPGSAKYEVGEEIVVFVEPKRHPTYRFVLGMASGKFQVLRKDGQILLHRDMEGLAFHSTGSLSSPAQIREINYSEPAIALASVRARIRARRHAIPRLRSITPQLTGKRKLYLKLLQAQRLLQLQRIFRQHQARLVQRRPRLLQSFRTPLRLPPPAASTPKLLRVIAPAKRSR